MGVEVTPVSTAIHAAVLTVRKLLVAGFFTLFGAEVYDQLWTRFL
jgi:hypothetical protein